MGDIRVFKAEHHDPWFNLATEDWLFNSVDHNTQVLFLWRNRPSIIIGRFQNPWNECNLEAMEADGVQLARRQSGGGAVYHDLGNTNFTFMSPKDDYRKERNFSIITQALAGLGVKAEISGRNDILVDGKKVSGNAFRISSDRAFHHGTLLINTDLTKLSSYLTPDKEKLQSKGIQSVASRVANISDFNSMITHEILSEAIVRVFFEMYGSTCTIEDLTTERLSKERELFKTYEKYLEWDWRFGITPEFSHIIKGRFAWGAIEIRLNVKEAKIRQVTMYSDAIAVEFIENLQKRMLELPYEKNMISSTLEAYAENLSEDFRTMVSNVIGLILKELG